MIPSRQLALAMLAGFTLSSCSDTTEPERPNGYWSLSNTWAGHVFITPNTDAPQWPADPVTINSAAIAGDSLEMSVSFGGGCREHSFLLLSDAAWMESNPVQVAVKLSHQANDDPCDALLTRVLRFDLTPLKIAYNSSYRATTGIIRMNIRGFSSVTYSW